MFPWMAHRSAGTDERPCGTIPERVDGDVSPFGHGFLSVPHRPALRGRGQEFSGAGPGRLHERGPACPCLARPHETAPGWPSCRFFSTVHPGMGWFPGSRRLVNGARSTRAGRRIDAYRPMMWLRGRGSRPIGVFSCPPLVCGNREQTVARSIRGPVFVLQSRPAHRNGIMVHLGLLRGGGLPAARRLPGRRSEEDRRRRRGRASAKVTMQDAASLRFAAMLVPCRNIRSMPFFRRGLPCGACLPRTMACGRYFAQSPWTWTHDGRGLAYPVEGTHIANHKQRCTLIYAQRGGTWTEP
jgi:hypothetical protein